MSDRITVEQLVRIRIPRHELLIELTVDEANELFQGLQDVHRGILALRPLRFPLPTRIPIVPTDEGLNRLAADLGVSIPVTEPPAETGPSLQDDIESMIAKSGTHTVDDADEQESNGWCPNCKNERCAGLGCTDIEPGDDADEQEAEFLSRLPRADIEPGEAELLIQTQPIKHPSNTPEVPAEPETVAETPAPSNDRQVSDQAGGASEKAADQSPQDRALSIWNRYREQYPDEKPNRTVSRIPAYFPVPRPTTADVRDWLRAKGIDVPDPLTRAEVVAQARAVRAASQLAAVSVPPPPVDAPKRSIEDVNAPMPLAGVDPEATVQLIHALARSARRRWPEDERSIRLHIEDLGPLTQLRKVSDAAIALFDGVNREWLDAYTDLPPFKQRDFDSALLAGWKKVAA